MCYTERMKKIAQKEGYTLAEMRSQTAEIIEESVARLRARLRAVWKKQEAVGRRTRHGATV